MLPPPIAQKILDYLTGYALVGLGLTAILLIPLQGLDALILRLTFATLTCYALPTAIDPDGSWQKESPLIYGIARDLFAGGLVALAITP